MHNTFKAIYSTKAANVARTAASLQTIQHPGLKGQLRELLVSEFLQPLLPPILGLGQGEIIDCEGHTSRQQDIIIYDRNLTPPALTNSYGFGVFPIDSVLYSFEVKSKVTAPELQTTHDNLCHLLREVKQIAGGSRFLLPGLIAFETDLAPEGKSELDRYLEMSEGMMQSVRMLCVLGRGFWSLKEHKGPDGAPGWEPGTISRPEDPGSQLLDLLHSILSGYAQQRQGKVADLECYLANVGVRTQGHV